ncbi:MAG: dihydrofolate reductase family protein [Thioploca sp.]|nr:dihydrofolate reductase family protein [Thioploca sp.]
MRKVILFMAVSLDSYIAKTPGEVDWLFTDNDYGYHNAIPDFVNLLKAQLGKILGMILAVHPIILGQGIPLFTQPAKTTVLNLQTSQIFVRGLIQMSYRLIQNTA